MNYGLTVEEIPPKDNKQFDEKGVGYLTQKVFPRFKKNKRTNLVSYHGRT